MKKITLLVIFFTAQLYAKTLLDKLHDADQLYAEKNYQEAFKEYKKITSLNPESIRALTGLAVTADILGFREEALNTYTKINKMDSENVPAITGISRIKADKGDFKGAEEILKFPLENHPVDPSLLFARAYIRFLQKNYTHVINLIEDINKRTEPTETTQAMLANAYAGVGNFNHAFSLLDKLIEKNPNNQELFVTRAKIYILRFEKKNKQEYITRAIEDLETALSIFPHHAEARRILIKLKIYTHEFSQAETLAQSLFVIFPEDAELRFLAAYLYAKNGNRERASTLYRRALQLNDLDESGRLLAEDFAIHNLKPNHPFRTQLGIYRFNQAQRNEKQMFYGYSLFNMKLAARLIPDNYRIKDELKNFYRRSGNAEEYVNMLIRLTNENPQDFSLKAELKDAMDKLKKTIAWQEGMVVMNEGIQINFQRTPRTVYFFDIKSEPLLASYPELSRILSQNIRNFLTNYAEFGIITGEQQKRIQSKISERNQPDPYSDSLQYSYGLQKLLVMKNHPIDIYVYGNGEFNPQSLAMKLNIIENETGATRDTISIRNSYRDSAAVLAVSVASKLKSIGYSAHIIRMKSEEFIINSGTAEGLKEGMMVKIIRDGNEIGQAKLTRVSRYLSIAQPTTRDFFRTCREGDKVIKIK